ncbi:hypothetical protein ACH79_12060 [Bradyrhizobium sp. CCBAU 051011]|nr:hypothetical protein ACH79_12060 [Bradyrhizobium sp. CCBAU 051011]
MWTPDLARKEAKVQLGTVAHGDNRQWKAKLDHTAITVTELCDLCLNHYCFFVRSRHSFGRYRSASTSDQAIAVFYSPIRAA